MKLPQLKVLSAFTPGYLDAHIHDAEMIYFKIDQTRGESIDVLNVQSWSTGMTL